MQKQKLLKNIYNLILEADNIFVQAHANCGDATGSTLAMVHFLESLNKKHTAFLPAPISENMRFLAGSEKVITNPNEFNIRDFNLLLLLDCGEFKMTGIMDKIISEKKDSAIIVNIDHHYTNDEFGDVNFVDKTAPSTTILIHEFFNAIGFKINKKIATNLLVGIFQDTGIFTNPATNKEALDRASDLLMSGVNYYSIINSFFNNRSFVSMKLWGRALERLVLNREYNLAYTVLLQNDFRELGIESTQDVEGLSNFLNNLSEASVTMVLREEADGNIKGSFRTTEDDYDVGRLAKLFGGGGHKKASGFSLFGQISYNEEKGHWEII